MLELLQITGGYGDTTVLRDVSLAVPDSSVVALLGPNGAGKTTTLRMASGLLRPRARLGRCSTATDITRLGPYRRVAARHLPHPRGPRHLPVVDGEGERGHLRAPGQGEGGVGRVRSTPSR